MDQMGIATVNDLNVLTRALFVAASLALPPHAAIAASATARAPDADLSRIDKVRVSASQITPDAVACGLSLNDVLPRIEVDLEAAGMTLVRDPKVLVTVSLMTAHDNARGICASTAMLGTYELVSYFDAREGWSRTGYVVLWQRGNQVISPVIDHPEVVERAVARLSRMLLDSWREARSAKKKVVKKQN